MKKIVIALFLIAFAMNVFTGCDGYAPSPEITEGEFNFSVTYEYNGGDINLVLSLYPDYFMGEEIGFRDAPKPYFQIVTVESDGAMSIEHRADVVEEICGAKIISFEYDEPIKNNFD